MNRAPRKRFGQNFLVDAQVIQRICDTIAPATDQLLIEIGPGRAAITRPLL
ncbi:MAG: 16S rRNA (adenine(1518)-N(6)/adenine(1519)-N(6))-dimethyltransferase, partial [Xanthomonadales bacterium]|nr:16S rRNA (adenine(1518)-N(6)/adenine(1519)-N(6))-dimethyltransferase [Xanthomonadales bacterium]